MPRGTVLALLAATCLSGCLSGWAAWARQDVAWTLQRRDLGFFDWRPRLAVAPGGEAWIGGAAPPGTPRGMLYRLRQGEWEPWRLSQVPASRTFVLAADPAAGLWVCAYSPTDAATYAGLRVRHWNGRYWRDETVVPGIWPQTMAMVSGEEGWIGGNNGLLLHRSRGRWQRLALPGDEEARKGLNVLALHMLGVGEGWLAGAQGLVAHYRDGRWQVVPVPASLRAETLFALDVTADGQVWVVGSHGLIARFDGRSWHRLPAPGSFHLTGLSMVSAQDGWAVGEYGTILRWDGARWRRQPSPTLSDLYDVVMVSPDEGWIVANGAVLRAAPRMRPMLRDAALHGRNSMARQPGREVAAVDADGDGDLDLFSLQPTSLHLFENRGREGFYEVPGLGPPPLSFLETALWGDVDGDGDLDLLVLSRSPAAAWLYRKLGGLRFAPAERLPVGPLGSHDSVALVDLDGDGDLDLFLLSDPGHGRQERRIYHNDGRGHFELAASTPSRRIVETFSLWGDLDGDLDLDAVLPGNGGRDLTLLLNRHGVLRDATAGSGLDVPLGEGRILQGGLVDLDLDGDLDVLLLGDRLYVFLNDGHGHFRRDDTLFDPMENNPAVVSTLSSAGDLDNDGYPEILLQPWSGNRRTVRLVSRGPEGRWHDIAARAGLADVTGNSGVMADWDGDGDLDLYVAGDEGGYLFENLQDDRSSLTVRLHGDRSNRSAVGARVRLFAAGHLGELAFLRGHQQLGAGFLRGAQDPSRLHFGLDPRQLYDLEAVFPSGLRRVEKGVRPGGTLEIFESPPGIRQALLGWRWARRAWLAADRRRELAKLGLVLLALALWRYLAARRPGASLLVRRWSLTTSLLAVYLLAAGCLAADGRPAVHGVQLLSFFGALALLSVADRRLTGWARARTLGPYRLLATLGEGGMGVVYRARHRPSGRVVALKLLHPRATENEDHRQRFLREARILTRLEHPNIVRVFETGEIDGRGYISMELLPGESLRRRVRRRGPLAPAEVRSLLAAAADALAYVHRRGIVHRDVKSDNLFLLAPRRDAPSDLRACVKLTDFGLARSVDASSLTGTVALLGTLAYIPPEILQGQPADSRSDLYSLGVAAYEALTGRLPFEAEGEAPLLVRIQTAAFVPLRRLRPEIPEPLAKLVEALLARDPNDRPASAEALAAALERLDGAPEATLASNAVPRWRERFAEAQRRLAAGSATEAQMLLMECLAEIEEQVRGLDPGERDSYAREHDVMAVLELLERLWRGY
jgi:serine/threonine protein kinase/photosystem II stability/assembly factor-like uncharacterized protein